MKKTLFLITAMLITFSAIAADYYSAELIYPDGSTRTGLADMIEFGGDDIIKFKTSDDAKVEKVESTSLSSIIYSVDEEEFRFDRLKVYKGWKQVKITEEAGWLQVVEVGVATLYLNQTTMQSRNQQGMVQGSATFKDYYIIREGEPAAKLIATISTANNNQTFRAKVPLYFEDHPSIPEKVKSKDYTWKDLLVVVKEYNDWAAAM